MARNRKSQSAATRFGPALKAAVICLLLGGSGVGYVWQKEQIVKLGQQKKERETRLAAFEKQNDGLRKSILSLRLPGQIEQRIKTQNLGLILPAPAQVWHIPEPTGEGVELTNIPRPREFAAQARGGSLRP